MARVQRILLSQTSFLVHADSYRRQWQPLSDRGMSILLSIQNGTQKWMRFSIPKILEGCLIQRTSSTQVTLSPGVVAVESVSGDRAVISVESSIIHNPDLSVDRWLYLFIVSDVTGGGSPYIVTDPNSTGSSINSTHYKRLIGAFSIDSGAVQHFIHRSPNIFEYTANTVGRQQTWNITNTGEFRTLKLPSLPLIVTCLFSSGLSANGGFYRLRFSSPDNILPVGASQAGDATFDADLYSRFTTAAPNYGDSIIKSIHTSNATIYTQKSGDPFLAASHQPSCHIFGYTLL